MRTTDSANAAQERATPGQTDSRRARVRPGHLARLAGRRPAGLRAVADGRHVIVVGILSGTRLDLSEARRAAPRSR
jgi:hypothetical protein